MTKIGKDIGHAKAILEAGDLVGIPTETVYGLAGNALNKDAVAKIFEAKNRPDFDPLIIHTGSVEQISHYTTSFAPELEALANEFWPGPLTVLLPKKSIIPDLVTSGLDQVAVRVPNHPLTRELLQSLDFPLAAPSANPFGYISPTTAQHVVDQLDGKIPYVLDGGECEVGLESTIVGLEDGQLTIFRLGGIEVSQIKRVAGNVLILPQSSSNPKTPGMLKSHYAPRKPFILGDLDQLVPHFIQKGKKFAVLSFDKVFDEIDAPHQRALSPNGDLKQAAHALFAYMRYLDSLDVDIILAEELPESGLGKAINDRLRRASAH